MMTSIRRLFDYNAWANRRVLDVLRDSSNSCPPPQAVRAFAHLLIAEKMWLVRLLKNEDTTGFDFWPEVQSLSECETLAEENQRAYAELLGDLTEESLSSAASYRNSRGVAYRTSYQDILTHVLFHSTYHRGQIATAVRAAGGTPAYTDYVAFVREQDEAANA